MSPARGGCNHDGFVTFDQAVHVVVTLAGGLRMDRRGIRSGRARGGAAPAGAGLFASAPARADDGPIPRPPGAHAAHRLDRGEGPTPNAALGAARPVHLHRAVPPGLRVALSRAPSLDPGARGDETCDADPLRGRAALAGARALGQSRDRPGLRPVRHRWASPASRAGRPTRSARPQPYFRLQRLFLRQTIDLGGETPEGRSGPEPARRLADRRPPGHHASASSAVVDVFDTNAYAHDPRHDFLNWALIDTGTFDYAADAWGYT